METYAVIDFETTGLSPAHGARPTEVAAVLVRNGKITESYSSLMNCGVGVPYFIEEMTGITNQMVSEAPKANKVMGEVAEFVGDHLLVAHKASFDSKFWDAELKRIRVKRQQEFLCSILLARRVFPGMENYKLETLARKLKLPAATRYHRALADAQVTAHLLIDIKRELKQKYKAKKINQDLLVEIQSIQPKLFKKFIEQAG